MEQLAHTKPMIMIPLALKCLDCGTSFLISWELITDAHCPGCGLHLHEDAIPERLRAALL